MIKKLKELDNTIINNNIKIKEMEKKEDEEITFIDLFAGTGAFTHSFEKHNRFKCVFSNDMVKSSEAIYNLNFPDCNFLLADLNTIDINDIPSHNILCGGFPCQPFSIAGEKKGFDDTRSNVFWTILKILKKHSPEVVILENVKNLKSHDKGNTYKVIEKEILKLGYFIKSEILDTSVITNIPQHRERIYIVCFKDENKYDSFNFDFPVRENKRIDELLEDNISDKYYYTDRFKVYDVIEEGVTQNINENILYQYRRYYVRENKSNCCPTLTANMGSGGHNVPLLRDDKGIRKLTPRECFNLQGFPLEYELPDLCDSSLYKLAGNAVSVPVIDLIVNKIHDLY
jgi:DNA (cytosine-5)-methyltransferase 1